jgi:AmmeMemoRadiSam system protein A
MELVLSIIQKRKILMLARSTIASKLNINFKSDNDDFSDPLFSLKCGAFVTLHLNGSLRGCIGYIQGFGPLHQTIVEMAEAAAFKDPRFAPVSVGEFKSIDIEISILSPVVTVDSIQDIVTGRDGIIIKKGYHSGLLLPQVASEYNWNVEQFLEHACMKAGLDRDEWRTGKVSIEKFTAFVFGDMDHDLK